jgi:hypothetical protein
MVRSAEARRARSSHGIGVQAAASEVAVRFALEPRRVRERERQPQPSRDETGGGGGEEQHGRRGPQERLRVRHAGHLRLELLTQLFG